MPSQRTHVSRVVWWTTVGLVAGTTMLACNDSKDGSEAESCVSNEQFFRDNVWAPLMSSKCASCHTATGQAKDSDLKLLTADWGVPDYLQRNLKVVQALAEEEVDGTSKLLLKPLGKLDHKGGEQIKAGSDEHKALEALVARLKKPEAYACKGPSSDEEVAASLWDGVDLLDPVLTLRKASLSLAGRLPTRAELQKIEDGGFPALDGVLDEIMREDAFFDRLREIVNDSFLTDRYVRGTDAIDLLDAEEDYPTARWFEEITDDDAQREAASRSNRALARECVELAVHLVREDRPFTGIVTADYTMVNPWSAKVYGLSNVAFQDSSDPNEFVEAKIPGIPHAGVLSSHVFLNRFPTTPTNRNRHRSRMIHDFFLATDVQALGSRPLDPASITDHNPTMNTPACVVCHAIIDPLAGTLADWDDMGRHRPLPGGWFGDMRPPGYGDVQMDPDQASRGVQWLGEQIAADGRFGTSIVHIMFRALTGQDPLKEPRDTASDTFEADMLAFRAQAAELQRISDAFNAANFNLKTIVKEVVKSPYYRASNITDFPPERTAEIDQIGTAHLLTPEQLHRKIEAVTGYPWTRGGNDEPYLLSENWYSIFYGGIDSDTVTERITEPNGVMANVIARMANEVACWTTARDFIQAPAHRKLFPYASRDYEPEDAHGFAIPVAADAIRTNIAYLHERLLGESLEIDAPEVGRTYDLFLAVWKDGKAGLASDTYDRNLPYECQAANDFLTGIPLADDVRIQNDPNYTIRAWMAVMSYLLSDYKFLHE